MNRLANQSIVAHALYIPSRYIENIKPRDRQNHNHHSLV